MSDLMNYRTARAPAWAGVAAQLAVAATLAGVLVTGCDNVSMPTPMGPGPLASITVTSSPILAINATHQFVAIGKDAAGVVVAITPTWSVTAGGGVIDNAGLFTAGSSAGAFTSTVKATSGSISGTASVTVTAGPLATIAVTPSPASMAINGTQQFAAEGKDAGGNVVAVTPTWSVVAGGGTINGSGLFTAGTVPGTFSNTVQAASDGISGTASVTVTAGSLATITVTPSAASLAINGTQQFAAVGKDAANNVVAITPTWSVVASGGSINGSGLFTAGTVTGTFSNTVRAASGSISGTASVTVTTGSLATITVSPGSAVLPANAPQQFTAVGRDAGGNVVAITPTWSVVASGGTISGSGLFTAGAVAGTFSNTVSAVSGSTTGTASVTVNVPGGSAGPARVLLGSAGNYVILAKSGISNVPTSNITGNLGLSPIASTALTGFSETLPAGSAFSTSAQVTGNIYASDYAAPTPANLTTAISDMETAYTDAAGRVTPDYTELAAGNIGGLTLPAGLYKWSSGVTIPASVTLQGAPDDVWIFQIAGGITQASGTRVELTGGALAENVFWQVFGVVAIGTGAHMAGQVLSQTSITLGTGATAQGSLLAQTAVTLDGNTIVKQP